MADTLTLAPDMAIEPAPDTDSGIYVASQWKLVWWKFRRHRLAMVGGIVTVLIYLVALFCEPLAPFDPDNFAAKYTYAPPQALHLLDADAQGTRLAPFVYGYKVEVEPKNLRRVFSIDPTQKIRVGLFVEGAPYKLLGIFPANVHVIGPVNPGDPMYLMGADRVGRDMLSRLIYGTRISMSVGLVGVALSLLFGILLGGISGYFGGAVDDAIQRIIELVRSIPTIPLWMGLAAALPASWPPLYVYFGITLIISLISWTGLARVVRGRFLSLRSEDFVMAARLDGAPHMRIIVRYMVPSFLSHIIASITLSIPAMILAETALSFLGLGLRPPIISWGVLLNEAQNIRAVATAPWLLAPGLPVVVAVLAMNFLGDGLRDAADPYQK